MPILRRRDGASLVGVRKVTKGMCKSQVSLYSRAREGIKIPAGTKLLDKIECTLISTHLHEKHCKLNNLPIDSGIYFKDKVLIPKSEIDQVRWSESQRLLKPLWYCANCKQHGKNNAKFQVMQVDGISYLNIVATKAIGRKTDIWVDYDPTTTLIFDA